MRLEYVQLPVYISVVDKHPASLLQLNVDLQFPGGLVAGWNTLTGVTPYWGNSMGSNWGSLSFEGLFTQVAQGSNCGPLQSAAICCFAIYLSFNEVNRQLSTCVLLYSKLCTVCTFIQYKGSLVYN